MCTAFLCKCGSAFTTRGVKKRLKYKSSLNRKLPPGSSSIHCTLDVAKTHVPCRTTFKHFLTPITGKACEYLERNQ